MEDMKRLTKDYRLQGYSHAEIVGPYERAISRLSEHFKLNDSKLKPGPFLNAFVLWFLDLDEAEQSGFASKWLARMEEFLNAPEDEPAALNGNAGGTKSPPRGSPMSREVGNHSSEHTHRKGRRDKRA